MVTSIEFQIVNTTGESIEMTPGNAVLKYGDKNQTLIMHIGWGFTAANVAALGDTDNFLETGQVFCW